MAQLYFLNQSVSILAAVGLIPAAGYLNILAYDKRKYWLSVVSVLMMQLIFSTYQIQMILYVIFIGYSFLILFRREEIKVSAVFRWIGYQMLVFVIGVLLYFVITKLFFSSMGGYLGEQIHWENGLVQGWKEVWKTVKYHLSGNIVYTSYRYFFLAWFLLSVYNLKKESKRWIVAAVTLLVEIVLFSDAVFRILPVWRGCGYKDEI